MKRILLLLAVVCLMGTYAQDEESPQKEFAVFKKKYRNSALKYKKIYAAVRNLVKQENAVYNQVLEAAKSHKSKKVRKWSCYTLGQMSKSEIPGILAERLQEEKSKSVKMHILDGINMNKGRDAAVPGAVMEYIEKYREKLSPQELELALMVLVPYSGGEHKAKNSDEIVKLFASFTGNQYIRRTLIRIFAEEHIYPIIRDQLLRQYFALGLELRKEVEQGEILDLLMNMARYRKKGQAETVLSGETTAPDYGAWQFLLQISYHQYSLEVFLQNINLFNYENQPLKDLMDALFDMMPEIKKSKDRRKAKALIKCFEATFAPHKIGETPGNKKGFERDFFRLEEWKKHWRKIRNSVPSSPAYDPYSSLTMEQFRAEVEKARAEKAKKEAEELERQK